MNIKDIPLICVNFNQKSYLIGLVNQFRFYYPQNPVWIVDNGSNYEPLISFYQNNLEKDIELHLYPDNDFIGNLNKFISFKKPEYYILSDVDLQIHSTTPPNFLEIFKTAIDSHGFHHAGFGLITDDIPAWNPKAGWIQGDEKALLTQPVTITHEGKEYHGHKAALDTTFSLWKRDNGGWKSPLDGESWGNSLRLFQAYHLPFYLDATRLNPEMQHYYATCKRRELGQPSAGRTHYAPDGV